MMKRFDWTRRKTTAAALGLLRSWRWRCSSSRTHCNGLIGWPTLDLLASIESRLELAERGSLKVRRNDKGEIREIRLYLKGSGLTVGNEFPESVTSRPSMRKLIVFHSEIDDDGLRYSPNATIGRASD